MTDEDRHRALIHAAVRSLHKPAVVSHASAVVLRDLPTWGLDLSEVHVTRGDLHSPRDEAGVYHHVGELKTEEIVSVQGVATTALARTVIDAARFSSFEAGVVVADAAFRSDPAAQRRRLGRPLGTTTFLQACGHVGRSGRLPNVIIRAGGGRSRAGGRQDGRTGAVSKTAGKGLSGSPRRRRRRPHGPRRSTRRP
jgi:hypothetical protein